MSSPSASGREDHEELDCRDRQPEEAAQQHRRPSNPRFAPHCARRWRYRRTEMPFAGELIQVREDERDWEGAAERLLHSFGLVTAGARRALPGRGRMGRSQRTCAAGSSTSTCRARRTGRHRRTCTATRWCSKLAVKPDSPFYDWLERELAHRFDLACSATQEQFRRETRAITRAGQIKDPTGDTKRTTATASMTATATCWAGRNDGQDRRARSQAPAVWRRI